MFTIIGAMAELESSLISERVRAGMAAAKEAGKHVGRPPTALNTIEKIQQLARGTTLSVRGIRNKIDEDVSRGVVGRVVKKERGNDGSE